MMKSLTIVLCLFLFLGCSSVMESISLDSNLDPYISESVDAFGYTLGLLAAKDPVLEERIENYYNQLMTQGLTLAVANEALVFLNDSNDTAYKVLAYKMSRLIKLFGAKFDSQGRIVDFGKLSQEYLVIGKDAYLLGLNSGGAV